MVVRTLTVAAFTLLVASGLCLTFAAITAFYALRSLEKSRDFLAAAWDFLEAQDTEEFRKEGTE